MEKKIVVFDIDDTLTDETTWIRKRGPKYLKDKYSIEAEITDESGYELSEVFGLNQYFSEEECKAISQSFNAKNFVPYMFFPLRPEAKETVKFWKDLGYEIAFATLRGKKGKEESNKGKFIRTNVVPFLTKMQLFINGIKYDQLHFAESIEHKLEIISEIKPKYVFDDNPEVIEGLSQETIAVIAETPHNVLAEIPDKNVVRVPMNLSGMKEVQEKYEPKIKAPRKKREPLKNLTVFEKNFTEFFYMSVKHLGQSYALKKINPLVIGEENIPTEKGRDLFIGNHRNIKDPILTICLLNNPVHYAALKRMFEYNENLFGPVGNNFGTFSTTCFVKAMGALPIARPNEENYMMVNLQTFKYMNDYLEKNSASAIYPEGTLNRNPEENGNILKSKSLQAFKLAENGKAVVRPIAVIWPSKEKNLKNKAIISFLKPIYTEGLQASEIEEKWLISMNIAIDSMNHIVDEISNINSIEYSSIEKDEKSNCLSKKI